MRTRLGDSLRYIVNEAHGKIAVPEGFDTFFDRLTKGPVSPAVFGAYCDLVLALEANETGAAERLLAEIAAAPNAPLGPRIFELSDPAEDHLAERYRRLVDTDPEKPFILCTPPRDAALRVRGLIGDAFVLLDKGDPELADEIRELVREIVLAAESKDLGSVGFEGVSSFMLWGGVILNVEAQRDALDMVQVLAHESGHNLLFGLCAYGPLHENDDEARYGSPLREDARPMDGVVHAAYVSARMHQAVQRLIDGGALRGTELDEARQINPLNAKRFATGMETVDRHARLTPLGRAVMAGARRYMDAYL
jgi:HEXXH motif-containing protein